MRSAITRRQSNYWCPGLNAGIPFIAKKKDSMHELTFQFHDISHFNIPDLVPDFTSIYEESLQRHVYIIYRLLSETITLVLADMIFVNSLFESGNDYKTVNQRKIYPILQKIIFHNPDEFTHIEKMERIIKKILYGSFRYCCYKDTSIWKELMNNDIEPLEQFSDKYDTYFMEDFKWTKENYDDMCKDKKCISDWWVNVKHFRNYGDNIELESISEFIKNNNLDINIHITENKNKINDLIFESVYNKYIKRIFNGHINEFNIESNLKNAFIRYMIGQTRIFFSFPNFKYSQEYFSKFDYSLKNISINTIDITRKFYNSFVKKLYDYRMISLDDVVTYEQVYPLFNPHYIDYDNLKKECILDIYVKEILGQ